MSRFIKKENKVQMIVLIILCALILIGLSILAYNALYWNYYGKMKTAEVIMVEYDMETNVAQVQVYGSNVGLDEEKMYSLDLNEHPIDTSRIPGVQKMSKEETQKRCQNKEVPFFLVLYYDELPEIGDSIELEPTYNKLLH